MNNELERLERMDKCAQTRATVVVDILCHVVKDMRTSDLLREALGSVNFRYVLEAVNARETADMEMVAYVDGINEECAK